MELLDPMVNTYQLFKALSIVFNPETKLIDLTLFEEHQDVAIPLLLLEVVIW